MQYECVLRQSVKTFFTQAYKIIDDMDDKVASLHIEQG